MGHTTAKDVHLALNLVKKVLKLISGLLLSVGKPLFVLFSYFFLGIVSFLYITGRTCGKIFGVAKPVFNQLIPSSKKLFQNAKDIRILLPRMRLRRKGVIFAASTKQASNILFSSFFNLVRAVFLALFNLTKVISKTLVLVINFTKDKFSLLVLKARLSVLSTSRNFLKLLALFFATGFLLLGVAIFSFWVVIMKDLPSPEILAQRSMPMSTKIYDRNGILLYTIFKDQNRTPVPLSEIPIYVRSATIAIEDAEFYSHPGFSVRGISRALFKDLREGQLAGGSTITQQLVKNTLLTPEKTVIRKLKEIVLAVEVELTYDKDDILEMYLNEVSYGGTAYGIQEAARTYFDKDVKDLTLAEASILAGLPKSPSSFSPYGENPKGTFARQKDVLNLMRINGFITEEQQRQAEKEEIKFAKNQIEIKAPHFVFYVRQILEEKYGKEVLEKGGLEVITSLDYRIQELAEQIVKEEVEKLSKLNVTNGAVIILDPQTGEILAMVGSKNYFDTEHDGNVNITTTLQSPGSSIKVVNYAYALSNGLTAGSVINDSPITFLVEGQPPYTPKNYEGQYRGSVTLRSAFAESGNIPAVKVLASYGVKNMVEMGQKMGITTWENPDNYGLSLTLGGGEVRLIDLARVYASVANYGVRPELRSVLKITDHQGKIVEEFSCEEKDEPMIAQASSSDSATLNIKEISSCKGERVIDDRVAFIITDILKDNQARSPSFGSNSLLIIPKHSEVAVKTGTSNNFRDNLAIGYTQKYVVAVWVGNNDNSEMARIASGVTGATPIWNKIMSALLSEELNNDWPIPPKLVQLPICPYTGTLACEGCPTKKEWFLEDNKPDKACSPEWFEKAEGPEEVGGKNEEEKDKNQEIRETQIYNPASIIDRLLESRFGKKKKPSN